MCVCVGGMGFLALRVHDILTYDIAHLTVKRNIQTYSISSSQHSPFLRIQTEEALLGCVTGQRSRVTNKGSYLRLKLDHSQSATDRERIKLSKTNLPGG